MGPAQTVGQVFFPLDEELALQPGCLTPRQQEHLTHLACWMPFARAAQMLDESTSSPGQRADGAARDKAGQELCMKRDKLHRVNRLARLNQPRLLARNK